jgi:DNA-binding transcriptional MerR regulator
LSRRVSVPVNAQGIPEKPYFKIGEVARICGVEPYVLRYWETEFRSLRPQKTPSHQRLYRRKDVELLLQIRHLLYEERFTIAGARGRLRELGRDEAPPLQPARVVARVVDRETLRKLKQGLVELLRLVQD